MRSCCLHVQAAVQAGADIIIFPEFSLGGNFTSRNGMSHYAEPVTVTSNPCAQPSADSPVLTSLSCLANDHNITLVANMVDRGDSPTSKGVWNTQVVFDPRGVVIAKYHKSHPWFTHVFDKPSTPDHVTFNVSASPPLRGVEFGLFVCFDIAFHDPAVVLVERGIRHFPYSIALDNIVGSGAEAAWSWLHKASLLAADEGTGHGGVFLSGKDVATDLKRFPGDQNGLLQMGTVPI